MVKEDFYKAQLAEDSSKLHVNLASITSSDDWWIERKYDGHRLLVDVQHSDPLFLNRDGRVYTKTIPMHIINSFLACPTPMNGNWLFDGELVGEEFWMFDVIIIPNVLEGNEPFETRRMWLERLFHVWTPEGIHLVPTARTMDEKYALTKKVIEEHGEGLMLKKRTNVYQFGKTAMDVLKLKFTHTCEAVITELHRNGKDAVGLGMFDEDGILQEVGACSVVGRRGDGLKIGMILEVKYLYATESGRLYQPIFCRTREDKDVSDCTMDQLVFSGKKS